MPAAGERSWRDGFPHLTDAWRATVVRHLLRWYGQHRRDLPWRRNPTPYRVWVSEIMLQQTQVATVIPYYQRFLRAFPSVRKLAAADEHEVLRLWEGLGYYRRARQMHAAAREIVARFGGRCPRTLEAWQSLPGVGRYTAGAILSIGLQQTAPILEANTQRLDCRLLAWEADPRLAQSQALLWNFAEWILATARPGDLNQALMELGSCICTPVRPRCSACPLQSHCPTAALRAQSRIPAKTPRVATSKLRQAAILIGRGNAWLLRQASDGERWAGLWDFLRCDYPPGMGLAELAQHVAEETGLQVELYETSMRLRHQVTRFHIELFGVAASSVRGRLKVADSKFRWFQREQLEQLALNVTGRKIVRLHLKAIGPARRPLRETRPTTSEHRLRPALADRRAGKR